MARERDIYNLLKEKKLVTQKQLDQARDEAKRTGLSFPRALEKLGIISEEEIVRVKAEALGVPYMDLTSYVIDAALIKLVPAKIAKKYKVVPLFKIGSSLTVAMLDPQDIVAMDQIRNITKMDTVEPILATEKGIQKILDSHYGTAGAVSEIVGTLDEGVAVQETPKDLAEAAEEAPIIKLVNIIMVQAVKDRASDVHIEPGENVLRVRYRIDGILHEIHNLPGNLHRAIASRIKILAELDIAEIRLPQDGRIRLKLENKNLDIRISTFPTIYGENIVMRMLDRSSVVLGLKEIGFSDKELSAFDKIIRRPHGIVLITGPTGSGKTTTIYAVLTTINSMEKNILTIEDPVEYELPLIRQTQVNSKIGITFANGLRSILRQDPDIIMVGEIRDRETAEIAIQAALTGHLVFSTLHTNDAPSSLTRLIDMKVEPFLISSSVIGILAQRLVRIICDKCKQKYKPDKSVLKDLGMTKSSAEFYRGKGCSKCKDTGYLGRTGIFELFSLDEDIRKMVNDKASADQIREKLVEKGVRTLKDDGVEKILAGITTPQEVLRVTREE